MSEHCENCEFRPVYVGNEQWLDHYELVEPCGEHSTVIEEVDIESDRKLMEEE